uniref:hypothetical protein n=1 Tax=Pseudonocardia sp. CA-138482 TaxID=3240023 RepID=UPI003F499DD7
MAGSTNMPDLRTRLTLDTSQFTAGLVEARSQAAMFGSAVGAVGGQFLTAATAMATFAMVGTLVAGVFATAFTAVVGSIMLVGVAAAAQSEQVKSAWVLTLNYIKRGMLAAAQAYIPILTQLAQNVQTAFTQVQPALMEVFERLAPVFGTLANQFLNKFVSIVDSLPNMVNRALAILQSVGPSWDLFLAEVGDGWDRLKETFFQFGAAILQGALPGIGQFFGAILGGIATVVQATASLAGPVFGALGAVATALGAAFAGVVQAILPELAQFGNTLGQLGLGLVHMLSGIGPPLAAIIADLNQLGPIVAAAAVALEPTIAGLLMDAAQMGQALMPLFAALGQFLPQLGPVLVALGQMLVQMAGGFIQGIAPLLAALGNASWSQGMVQGIQAITPVLVHLATVFGEFVTFVVQGFGWIINALATLFAAFSSVVPGLNSIGLAGGKALMVGLIAGIAFLVNPLLGVVVGVIGAIAAFLPHSPADTGPLSGDGSPNARGQALAKDFAAGIAANTGLVKTAAANLASAATAGVNPASTSPLSSTSTGTGGLLTSWLTNLGLTSNNGGNVTVNVAGSVLSQQELMATIQTASLRKQNRNAGSTMTTAVRSNA